MDSWFLILVGGISAGFVQGLAGFGFGLVSLAIWSWVLEPEVAVPTVVFGSLIGQLLAIGSLRRDFNFKKAKPFLIGGVFGMPVGLGLLRLIDPLLFKFGVGLLLCCYCFSMLMIARIKKITWGGKYMDGFIGWLGGIAGGFGGIPGPIPTIWCNLRGWSKHEQRTVFQLFNLTMHIITFISFLAIGMVNKETISAMLIVAPSIIIPTLFGIYLYRKFSDNFFKLIVLTLLFASGALLLVEAAPQVFKIII